jgi:hypothetical protein
LFVLGQRRLRERDPKNLIPPLNGALIRMSRMHLFEQLAFMARREGR